jgi:hypothetical protein
MQAKNHKQDRIEIEKEERINLSKVSIIQGVQNKNHVQEHQDCPESYNYFL